MLFSLKWVIETQNVAKINRQKLCQRKNKVIVKKSKKNDVPILG
jgi:hypothetical protein